MSRSIRTRTAVSPPFIILIKAPVPAAFWEHDEDTLHQKHQKPDRLDSSASASLPGLIEMSCPLLIKLSTVSQFHLTGFQDGGRVRSLGATAAKRARLLDVCLYRVVDIDSANLLRVLQSDDFFINNPEAERTAGEF